MRTYKIFVYGSLLDESLLSMIVGRIPYTVNTVLNGYKKVGLNIIKDKKDSVIGKLIKITEEEKSKLDTFERLGELYREIKVVTQEGEKAISYQKIDNKTQIKVQGYGYEPFRIRTVPEYDVEEEGTSVQDNMTLAFKRSELLAKVGRITEHTIVSKKHQNIIDLSRGGMVNLIEESVIPLTTSREMLEACRESREVIAVRSSLGQTFDGSTPSVRGSREIRIPGDMPAQAWTHNYDTASSSVMSTLDSTSQLTSNSTPESSFLEGISLDTPNQGSEALAGNEQAVGSSESTRTSPSPFVDDAFLN